MDRKNVPVSSVRGLNDADGIVEAIVSVTNIVDSVNDVIEPGAYKNTLRKRSPKGVWSHDTNIPVAKTIKVEELLPGDQRLPEDLQSQNAGALLVKMQFNLNTSRGRDAFYDVQFFAEEQEWSIGYSVPEGKSTTDEETGVRFIKALELYEYSPVIFGAAPSTRTLSIKEDVVLDEEKASPEDVMVGTPVSFSVPKPPERAESAHGIVEKITRSGEVRIGSEKLEASNEDPVATVRVYAIMEDGSHQRTDRRVIKNVSKLRVIEDFRQDEKEYAEYEEKAGRYDDLNFGIPEGVKKQAEIGLNWSKEYNRGGTAVGKNTARYLINNRVAGPEKVRHIARYFPRHEIDLRTPSNSKPGADGYPGAGLIAWKLWGGDAGRSWSSKLVEAMNRRDEKERDTDREQKAPAMSASVEKSLRKKVSEHNEKYGDSAGKRATYSMLAACYRRGIGAYRNNPGSVRPTVSSAEQWAMARVNGLLYALRTGRFRRKPYDQDLLPAAHPLSTRGKDIYTDMPEGEPGSFGTPQRPGVFGRQPRRRRTQEGKPYRISRNIGECSGYAVVKQGEDSPVPGGCHGTLAEARQHMAALYAAEAGKSADAGVETKHQGHGRTHPNLAAEEAALHDALAYIASVYGKFDEDYDGIWAGYDSPAENDVKDIGVKCANCTLYQGEGVCTIIKQTVQENGKCRFAIIPDGVVEQNDMKSYDPTSSKSEQSDENHAEPVETKKNGGPIRSHQTAVRDDEVLDRSAILAVRSPEEPSYFKDIFAYQLPDTDGTRKTHYTFIHHYVSKDGKAGAAALSELRAAMTVLNGGRGGTTLRGADRKSVYNHIARHYRDGGETPPSLKSDEEVDNLMIKAGFLKEPLTKAETDER